MEILAAYDLTRSYRDAAKICGVSHNTVRSYVKARQEGVQAPVARARGRITDPFLPQMKSLVEQSRGKIRGDVVHGKLVDLGYPGSIRTTRYVLAGLKSKYRAQSTRVHRPWTVEPGCGSNGTTETGPSLTARRRCCSWPGWRIHASGS
jgi:transposase